MHVSVPAWRRLTVKAPLAFALWDQEEFIGPVDRSTLQYTVETGAVSRQYRIETDAPEEEVKIVVEAVKPPPEVDPIPVAGHVAEAPTLQEQIENMMWSGVRPEPTEYEFDDSDDSMAKLLADDDEGEHSELSQYQLVEMEEEYHERFDGGRDQEGGSEKSGAGREDESDGEGGGGAPGGEVLDGSPGVDERDKSATNTNSE